MSGSGGGRDERERAIGDKRAFKGDHCSSRFDGWINYGVMA